MSSLDFVFVCVLKHRTKHIFLMKFIDCNLIFLRSYRGYTFKGFVSFFLYTLENDRSQGGFENRRFSVGNLTEKSGCIIYIWSQKHMQHVEIKYNHAPPMCYRACCEKIYVVLQDCVVRGYFFKTAFWLYWRCFLFFWSFSSTFFLFFYVIYHAF